MRLLLDENLPKRLKSDFPEHEIYTVNDMAWNSQSNGALLTLMLEHGFQVFFTFDKNIRYQQNFQRYPIVVLELNAEDNAYDTLRPLVPKIKELLHKDLPPGPTEVK